MLIDSIADYQIFSDGYDCDLRDIFALQDELVAKVIDAIADRLYAVEVARARLQTHKNLTSWQSILRAIWLINTRQKSQVATAERILRRATTTDPKCATAFALLSFIKTLRVHMGWQSRIEVVPDARRIAKYAISLNTDDPWAHLALGYATLYWRTEEAFELLRQALDCDPNLATAHYLLALASSFTGDSPAAFRHADMADKLKAYDLLAQGNTGAHDNVRATSCFIAGRYHDGMAFARKVIRVNPRQTPAYRQLALNSAFAGELEDAANALGAVRRLSPNIQQWLSESARSWRQREDYQKYLEGFRLAGLPYAAGRIHP